MSVRSYAIGIIAELTMNDEIVEYLERIDDTLQPFDGHFLVHGEPPELHEGEPAGPVVVIEFPTPTGAADWYRSPDYQDLVGLRARNSNSTVFTVRGVPADHAATDIL